MAADCVYIPHGETILSAPFRAAIQQCILEARLIALRIRHRTTYTYRRPVSLGPVSGGEKARIDGACSV